MKKKIMIVLWCLFALTAIYTPVAALLVRGLGAYRLNTTLGMVLAYSWPYTAMAAAALLLAVGIPLAIRLLKVRQEKLAAAPAEAPELKQEAKVEKTKKQAKKLFKNLADAVQPVSIQDEISGGASEAPIPPAPPAQPVEQTEKLAPASPAEPVEQTEKLAPAAPEAVAEQQSTPEQVQIGGDV